MMDKMLKIDKQQRNEIKQLKKTLSHFCNDFDKIDKKIQRVMDEKEQVERVLMEVVSFGEQCDARYDSMRNMVFEFGDKDKNEYEKMKKVNESVKRSLESTVKNIIVEIEDHQVRDELLSLLTSLNSQSLDSSVSQIVEKLIGRIRDLLLKNKRLTQINSEKMQEVDTLKKELGKDSGEAKKSIESIERLLRESDVLTQRIILKISDAQLKFGNPENIDLN